MLDKSALYDWRTTCTCNKGYGRLCIRELVARTDLNNFKTQGYLQVAFLCLSWRLRRSLREIVEVVAG